MTQSNDRATIIHILRTSHTIAVVGLSGDAEKPSHDVARFLQKRGYHIIPVNPNLTTVLGEVSYPDLLTIPESIDVVDIFRRPEAVPSIVDQAIQVGAKAVWMQSGVRHPAAAAKAHAAGLKVVMDRCMMEEIRQLIKEGTLEETPPSSVTMNPL
jgi:hypothetical protein